MFLVNVIIFMTVPNLEKIWKQNKETTNFNIQVLTIYHLNHFILGGITTTGKAFICRGVNIICIRQCSLQFNAKTIQIKLATY